MKKYLLTFGLFLLFASNAQAFTCYNGFELKKKEDGTEYCKRTSEASDYPNCHTADPDVDMYWDMATQKCVRCHPFYYSCEVIAYYEDGTTFTSGKDCHPKFLYCQSCNRKKCTLCLLGFTLQDNKCVREVACPSNCSSCSSSSTCTVCNSGYTLKNGACEKKPVCPENADCSDGNVTCYSGYELKNGACVKPACSANCTACSSSTACTACDSGYSLIGGKCVAGTVAKCPPDSSISPDGCCCVPN